MHPSHTIYIISCVMSTGVMMTAWIDNLCLDTTITTSYWRHVLYLVQHLVFMLLPFSGFVVKCVFLQDLKGKSSRVYLFSLHSCKNYFQVMGCWGFNIFSEVACRIHRDSVQRRWYTSVQWPLIVTTLVIWTTSNLNSRYYVSQVNGDHCMPECLLCVKMS